MAGYSVPNQMFAVCNQVSQGLLVKPVSGLLGLAFQSIASSGAMPIWQTLVSSGAWDSPMMSFHLSRLVDQIYATESPFPKLFFILLCQFHQCDVRPSWRTWRFILDG